MLICVLIGIATGSGVLISYFYDADAPFAARLSAGACVGFALLGLLGFIYASLLGLTAVTLWLTAATLTLPFVTLTSAAFRSRAIADIRASLRSALISRLVLLLLGAALLARFASGAVFVRSGAIYTNAINNIGDLPLHVSMISSFLYGHNFPPEHTQFAGARLTYPFVADFLTALLMRAGATLGGAIFLQTFLLMLSLACVVYRWAVTLTRDRSAAVFSLLLLLLSGGLGWWLFLDDVRRNGGNPLSALSHLSHEYTTEAAHGLRWGNLLETILLPQRSALLGLPLVVVILTLWWQALNGTPDIRSTATAPPAGVIATAVRRMIGAGFVAGLLPLVHTTSFIVMMSMAACLMLLFRQWRCWVAFFGAAMATALLQLWWFGHGTSVHAGNMFAWQFGWDRGHANAVWFWLKNTGLFIPLLLVAICWRGRDPVVSRKLLLFYSPFLLCFIVPNVARLMPWIWDNIKALMLWYVASVPLVALLLARLWRRRNLIYRAGALGLLVSMTLAGSLDVWRVVAKTSEWVVFDREAVSCAETIKKATSPRALVLHAPINNHAVFLSGRRSLLGLTFMAWVHGLNYGSRESDIEHIYTGASDAENLLERYKVDYAVVGPAERSRFKVNDAFFSKFPKLRDTEGCDLYQITRH